MQKEEVFCDFFAKVSADIKEFILPTTAHYTG